MVRMFRRTFLRRLVDGMGCGLLAAASLAESVPGAAAAPRQPPSDLPWYHDLAWRRGGKLHLCLGPVTVAYLNDFYGPAINAIYGEELKEGDCLEFVIDAKEADHFRLSLRLPGICPHEEFWFESARCSYEAYGMVIDEMRRHGPPDPSATSCHQIELYSWLGGHRYGLFPCNMGLPSDGANFWFSKEEAAAAQRRWDEKRARVGLAPFPSRRAPA